MRDRLLDAILVHVPDKGWSPEAVRAGTQDIGISVGTVELLFPDGWRDALICFLARADRSMSALAGTPGFSERSLHERVEQLVLTRLEALFGHREAVRRAKRSNTVGVAGRMWPRPVGLPITRRGFKRE